MQIYLRIPGTPVPKARPRVLKNGMSYTPKKTADYEQLVKDIYGITPHGEPLEGGLLLKADFYFPIPKSYTKAQRSAIEDGKLPKTTRPDLDNLVKSVTDALNGLAYQDDSQIIMIKAKKYYTEGKGYADISLTELF